MRRTSRLASCQPHDFPQYPANYREYAYVTKGAGNTVSIYDVVTSASIARCRWA